MYVYNDPEDCLSIQTVPSFQKLRSKRICFGLSQFLLNHKIVVVAAMILVVNNVVYVNKKKIKNT